MKIYFSVFVMCTVMVVSGCRSKIKAHTNSGPSHPAADPNETDETEEEEDTEAEISVIESQQQDSRKFFQSRSIIRLAIDKSTIEEDETLTIVNETTGETLLQNQPLLSLHWNETFSASLMGANDLWFSVFPHMFTNKFVYGQPNQIAILVDGAPHPGFSGKEVTLRDFDIFAIQGTKFANGRQINSGFQGWVNPLTRGGDSDRGGSLISGFSNIINH